jgi:hypothetical protein
MIDALRRFWIFRIHIPVRDLAVRLRSLSRRLRGKLRSPKGTLPEVGWASLCRDSGVIFTETRKADGNVNLAETAVLNALCRTYRPRTVFEIGTFDGRTTLNFALNCDAEIHTLDLPAAELPASDVTGADIKYVDKPVSGARFKTGPGKDFPCVKRIFQHLGDSSRFDFSPWHGKVDLIFVDGAHTYDFVKSDSEAAFKMLSPNGGVVVWHDYGVWPDVAKVLDEIKAARPDLPLVNVRNTSLAVSITVHDRP